jgi:hypothetical protein
MTKLGKSIADDTLHAVQTGVEEARSAARQSN